MRNSNRYGIIRHLAGALCLLVFLLTAVPVRAAGDEETVARNFLKFLQSDKSILSEEVMERSLLDPALAPIPVAHLFQLEGGGYILVSKDRSISPVKAYSLVGDFASLPEAYRTALLAELELRLRVAMSGASRAPQEAGVTETEARWDFLLSFDASRIPLDAYAPGAYLLRSRWNQTYPYNKFLPAISGQTVLAGCVNVALAQIMRHYKYPAAAKGVLSYTWNGQPLKTILYRSYNWDNMPDSADATTPEYQADEAALLIKDLGIANRTAFGVNDSSTSFRSNVLKENFGYSTSLATMGNTTDFEGFLTTLKGEIGAGRPVLLTLPNHMVVADGYSVDPPGRKIHINMGWGGSADDFYFLDQPVPKGNGTSFDTSAGNLSINYNIKPCSGSDCAINLEAGDGISGLAITGNFDRANDADLYEVYLKGSTTFSATRGYSNVAFNVSIINAMDGSEVFALADPVHAPANTATNAGNLPAGKYLIRVSLCNDSGWCFSPATNYDHYTVTLTTDTVSAAEKAAIDQGLNKPPVIGNGFPDIILNAAASPLEPRRILIDARDENNDDITLSVGNSNPAAVKAVFNGKILELTPTGIAKVASRIVVTASANGQTAEKAFTVLTDNGQTAFGKSFIVSGKFASQNNDVQNIPAILEGDCQIQGDNGYSSQAFFSSIVDSSGVVRGSIDGGLGTGDKKGSIIDIKSLNRGIYSLRATRCGPSFCYLYFDPPPPSDPPGVGWAYKLAVTCPAADVSPTSIAGLLGIDLAGANLPIVTAGDLNGDGVVNMIDAILALQLLSGMDMTGKTIHLKADADGGGRIGPAEAIFILQKAAGLRTP